MNNFTIKVVKVLFCCLICIISLFSITKKETSAYANSEHLFSTIHTFGNFNNAKTRIDVTTSNNENFIFLPAAVCPENVILYADFPESSLVKIKGEKKEAMFVNGMNVNLNEFCIDENYILKFLYNDGEIHSEYEIRFLFSKNVSAIYLVSDNPTEKGRDWIESSLDKSNKSTGFMIMQKQNGDFVYDGTLTQIKGRGNSTWNAEKKPYQIKTESKVDLLETGEEGNSSKTWVLLANYVDSSLLRNTIALNLGNALDLKYGIESTHVVLYYDGEYRGSYLLTEKVEIGSGRVNIENLEDKNNELNENIDIENLPIETAVTGNGATYTYCAGMKSPEQITGGYLLEMDYPDRAIEEVCYFYTTRGQHIVVKSPEYATKEEMEYIASLYQEYEDAVYNGGINPYTGKLFSDYVDSESTAIYYLVNEFAKTKDFFNSSAYLYKNSGEEKMYMGPLWDFDSGFGINSTGDGCDEPAMGLSIYNTDFSIKLLSIDDFYKKVQDIYNNKFYPLVKNVVLGDYDSSSKCGSLKSILYESDFINSSSENNLKLWGSSADREKGVEKLTLYISERINYMNSLFKLDLEGLPQSEMEFFETTYKDVSKTSWYYDDVEKVTELNYMNGIGNKLFGPDSKVKRSETAQVIFNMSNIQSSIIYQPLFLDVTKKDWFSDAVVWAANLDIMDGYSDGTFRPEQYVTREEIIYFLYNSQKITPPSTNLSNNFVDNELISEFAKDAIEWAIGENIIRGDENKRINPQNYLTRAEFATILVRYSN